MSKKVYLSPPYHYYNPCAISGCDENTHNNEYLDELEVYLHAAGIETKRGPWRKPKTDADGDSMMIQAVKESNAWGADVHYISHTNAFNGSVRGYRPMIYPGSIEGEKLAKIMIAEREKIYDQDITLFTRSDLYELRASYAPAYYEEHVFHDNKADAEWFHANKRKIAESAARGLCTYLEVAFVDPHAAQNKPETPNNNGVVVTLPVLAKGDENDQVKSLQALLKGYGYDIGSWGVDGDFGAATDTAVKKFQAAHNLEADGIVGKATWPALLGM